MDIGVFSILFNDWGLEKTLAYLSQKQIHTIEIGTGGYSRSNHLSPADLLDSPPKLQQFQDLVKRYNFTISGLGAQGNPVHPDINIAKLYQSDYINTVLIAEKLGVDTILLLSGCPGGSKNDSTPNWITCSWPEDYSKSLEYQWEEVLVPYWNSAAAFAKDHGIKKLAIEPHPGFSVYNPETLLRLRNRIGTIIGANFDPSHLFWQGIDPQNAIHLLKDSIFHVHAKDCFMNPDRVKTNGVLNTKPYSQFSGRSWNFRTVGFGHSEEIWKNIISALAEEDYDGTVSIEHEDTLMNREEGLDKAIQFLSKVVIRQSVSTPWWELRSEG